MNRFTTKANKEIARLAKEYIRKGTVASEDEFKQRFGWDADRLAHDLQWVGCYGCGCECLATSYSVRQITVEIIDPQRPPDYLANAGLLCPDCAWEKQDFTAEGWAIVRNLRVQLMAWDRITAAMPPQPTRVDVEAEWDARDRFHAARREFERYFAAEIRAVSIEETVSHF